MRRSENDARHAQEKIIVENTLLGLVAVCLGNCIFVAIKTSNYE
jgi:hypothetical protein